MEINEIVIGTELDGDGELELIDSAFQTSYITKKDAKELVELLKRLFKI